MSLRFFSRLLSALGLLLTPELCAAQRVVFVNAGFSLTIPDILNGIINALLIWAAPVATTLFLIGAFILTASGGEETYKDNGKKIMKAALFGLAIISGSWMILSTIVYYLAA